MDILSKLSLAGMLVGGAYYAASTSSTATAQFNQPIETAIKRLEVKSRVVNGTGMGSLTVSGGNVNKAKGEVAIWVARAGMSKRVRCLVTLTADSAEATSTSVDCTQPQAKMNAAGKIGETAMMLVVREHVAATIDARDYNVDQVADQMIGLVSASAPVLAATLRPPGD